jgi:integrase
MANIIVVPRTDKKNKKGEVPLRLQINYADGRAYLPTGIRVKLHDWNANKREIRKTHREADKLNRLLTSMLDKARGAVIDLRTEGRPITLDRIHAAVERALNPEPEDECDFLTFGRSRLEVYERRGQLARQETLRIVLDKIERYHRSRSRRAELPFSAITLRFVEGFETFLVEEVKNGPNTVAKTLKGFRTLTRAAMREGLLSRDQDPFFHITIREHVVIKRKLTPEEMDAIAALDLPAGSPIWHTRNYFLFAHYLAGIRFGDLARLRWRHIRRTGTEYRLTYRMGKTQDEKELLLLPPALAILSHYDDGSSEPDSYVFPILTDYVLRDKRDERRAIGSANTRVNLLLKEIQALAGIETTVSFHMARHSFADRARRAGWSLHTIKDALGHATLAVTERYLAGFDAEVLDARMRELFSD